MYTMFAFCIALGCIVVASGCLYEEFGLLIIGRGIYGVGTQGLLVGMSKFTYIWLGESGLAMALGLLTFLDNISGSMTSIISPWVYEKSGNLTAPFSVGAGISLFSLLASFCLNILTGIKNRKNKKR